MNADCPSRFGIIPRHGDNTNIRWFESSSCYIFHTLNAYEIEDEVVLIACRMRSTNILVAQGMTPDPEGDIPRLYEWRFNLTTGKVVEQMLDEVPGEFPRVNENFLGRKSQYGYVAKSSNSSLLLFNGLIKYDLNVGKSETHEFGEGRYGSEAVFVPRPGATIEDDGWLVNFVHDQGTDTSEMIVIDAQDFTNEPIARVLIPQRVPYGFHGTWIPEI